MKDIAQKVYGDPSLDFIISYFNDLKTGSRLDKPRILIMPKPEIIQALPFSRPVKADKINITELLKRAASYLQEKNYLMALKTASEALKIDKHNSEALSLVKDINKITESYYIKAVDLYKGRKKQKAIIGWKNVLAINPNHIKARDDIKNVEIIQKAFGLYEEKRYVEARSKADIAFNYGLTNAEASRLINIINSKAEDHLKAGVKHFLDEKLEQAIGEWKITLELNPNHYAAKRYIKTSENLIEKLRSIK